MLPRRSSHVQPAAPMPSMSHRNSIMTPPTPGRKKRPAPPSSEVTTLPLLDTATRAETAPMGASHSTAWPSPRHDMESKIDNKAGLLSLEKSLELLDKILIDGGPPPSTGLQSLAPSTITPAPPSTTKLEAVSPARRGPSPYVTFTNPQREDLYETIAMLKKELTNERAARRLDTAPSTYTDAGDEYFAALGRNAELHVRARKLESAAQLMKSDLEVTKAEQKRALDSVNLREEKLRNLIKKNKCLMTEYEVLKDQYVETKVKSVEVYRTMQLEQKRWNSRPTRFDSATKYTLTMLQEKLQLQHQVAVLRTELKDLQKTSVAEKSALQTTLNDAQAERDRLVLCLAETRHHFKQWKDREGKLVAAARNDARDLAHAEASVRIERCHDEIRLLRDKVNQLEQTNQVLRKEPALSPMELAYRKQQLHADMTTQHADLIALQSREMLTAAQETVSQVLHAREVSALEQLTYMNPPRAPKPPSSDGTESPLPPESVATPPTGVEKPRAPPATAPSPRVQTQRRKGSYKESAPNQKRPTPPPQVETNTTVATWKMEVRNLTEQVDEYKTMVVALSHEIEKLKAERKRLTAQKQSDTERKYEAALSELRSQLETSRATETQVRDLLASMRATQEAKSAGTIQRHLRMLHAKATLKSKLKATRAIQACYKGHKLRQTTNLQKRHARRVGIVQVWADDIIYAKYIPVRLLGLYVAHGVSWARNDVPRLQKALAAQVSLVPDEDDAQQIHVAELQRVHGQPATHVKAITKIQSRAKGYLTRKSLQQTLIEQVDTVRRVQALVRGFLARRQCAAQQRALIAIQAAARGYFARRSVRLQQQAIEKIQAIIKGMLTRQELEKQRASAIVLQKQAKGFVVRQSLERRRTAAVVIQTRTRGHLKKKEYTSHRARTKAATAIQARAKGFVTRRTLETTHDAAATIQRHARGFVVRQELRTRQASAVVIQSHVRSLFAKQTYAAAIVAVTKIQAGARGFGARRHISFRPIPFYPSFDDDAQDEHRWARAWNKRKSVAFRIRCVDAPKCVKIEAVLDGVIYSAFVKYPRLHRYVDDGARLFRNDPGRLNEALEPLCVLEEVEPFLFTVAVAEMDTSRIVSTPLPAQRPTPKSTTKHFIPKAALPSDVATPLQTDEATKIATPVQEAPAVEAVQNTVEEAPATDVVHDAVEAAPAPGAVQLAVEEAPVAIAVQDVVDEAPAAKAVQDVAPVEDAPAPKAVQDATLADVSPPADAVTTAPAVVDKTTATDNSTTAVVDDDLAPTESSIDVADEAETHKAALPSDVATPLQTDEATKIATPVQEAPAVEAVQNTVEEAPATDVVHDAVEAAPAPGAVQLAVEEAPVAIAVQDVVDEAPAAKAVQDVAPVEDAPAPKAVQDATLADVSPPADAVTTAPAVVDKTTATDNSTNCSS
ncbi:hypothetical protein SPRG_00279 [Saprolegnia parasitica CBS 223.65]|uniref:Uncharacterized protein n=1 Tax=Saprolegnia parasitica (strain CBS 223.65) TaxID=695850 RepID=A0A067D9V1_SAPPC|nr:hypothetical protein SPRG_00279 [Saprolegnia parasitica CBS 223.65]KDO35431.1 hypothetical protein SPRG_00279 [Saprolegnia parasitica CBS 223.65]|eukprot:XP_012193771.1 hypothetical protein SPRG_00279 [Saprolegnia parasitica CBS 223.65]